MKEIIWKPELHRFSSCKEFVEEFRLGASDLILTNEYIYQPYFGAMNLKCAVLYQEQYGMGEPTDVMAEAILRTRPATGCNRVSPSAAARSSTSPRCWRWAARRALTSCMTWRRSCPSSGSWSSSPPPAARAAR